MPSVGYRLWIDDDSGKPGIAAWRNPPDPSWKVAHSSKEAIELIEKFGVPSYISWDHDLGLNDQGEPDTAMVVLKYLSEHHFNVSIEYNIHSANPEGAKNINCFMKSWERAKQLP